MKAEFRKSFTEDIKTVSDKNLLRRVKNAVKIIERSESLNEVANLKKLKAEENHFRLRIGEYRLGLALRYRESNFRQILTQKRYL